MTNEEIKDIERISEESYEEMLKDMERMSAESVEMIKRIKENFKGYVDTFSDEFPIFTEIDSIIEDNLKQAEQNKALVTEIIQDNAYTNAMEIVIPKQ